MILNGWKEISEHLGRGVRTVQRWEKLGLPVRRPNSKYHSTVVAFSEELDEWLRAEPHPPSPRPGFRHRILVVDDDEPLLVTKAALLIKEGYEVRTARDGFEALAAVRVAVPDLLISDLRMPNMSGFELLGVVRRRFPAMAVIATSGEYTPLNRPAVVCDRYVEKGSNSPFELVEAIRELLSQSPIRSQPARLESAPAWIPRATNGYIVLTCLACLRSFSIQTSRVKIGEVSHEPCIHCETDVPYRIDETALPFVTELTVLERTRNAIQLTNSRISETRQVIDDSQGIIQDHSRRQKVKR